MDITALPEQPDVNYRYSDGVFTAPVTDAESTVLIASSRLAAETEEASRIIAPLQDAIDISIATNEEITRLSEWKRYRVELSRIDVSKAPDISWPEKPD